jgi:two-component system, OmpR family, response regulator ResD
MASKQKILIVDDDTNISELIALYLTKECFETMCVEDGEAALKACVSFKPDLILLDLMLPGMDGYQVCREVRKTSSTPIIMLSAKGEVFDKVLGLELGADDYMIKPFDSKELVGVFGIYIDGDTRHAVYFLQIIDKIGQSREFLSV